MMVQSLSFLVSFALSGFGMKPPGLPDWFLLGSRWEAIWIWWNIACQEGQFGIKRAEQISSTIIDQSIAHSLSSINLKTVYVKFHNLLPLWRTWGLLPIYWRLICRQSRWSSPVKELKTLLRNCYILQLITYVSWPSLLSGVSYFDGH